jgi:hypothetical protein
MEERVKIRGIYSTALTRLFLGADHQVVQPSARICRRFGLQPDEEPFDVFIRDRSGLQGVSLEGRPDAVCGVLKLLCERLLDAVMVDFKEIEDREEYVKAKLELPGIAKSTLDSLRDEVIPTLEKHHRFRTFDSNGLERAEEDVRRRPLDRVDLEERLFEVEVLNPLKKSGAARVEHVKARGRPIPPRNGAVHELHRTTLIMRRIFFKGRYDGLDLPIECGDYGFTEIQEGSWVVKHSYFSHDGKLKGEYYNVNTPVELYPYGARYVDLEVDVVRRAGEKPKMVDAGQLELLCGEGLIRNELKRAALNVAQSLMERLRVA